MWERETRWFRGPGAAAGFDLAGCTCTTTCRGLVHHATGWRTDAVAPRATSRRGVACAPGSCLLLAAGRARRDVTPEGGDAPDSTHARTGLHTHSTIGRDLAGSLTDGPWKSQQGNNKKENKLQLHRSNQYSVVCRDAFLSRSGAGRQASKPKRYGGDETPDTFRHFYKATICTARESRM